jgi:hypothetical protein
MLFFQPNPHPYFCTKLWRRVKKGGVKLDHWGGVNLWSAASVFLWSFGATENLNRQAMTVLEDNTTHLFFSAASSWEISIKSASGKLKLPERASTYVP